MDVVYPSLVQSHDLNGDYVWITQVAESKSVCLPMARGILTGPFGEFVTEAAVYPNLPIQLAYLFSNHSAKRLKEKEVVPWGLAEAAPR